jgi:hypothetical protein
MLPAFCTNNPFGDKYRHAFAVLFYSLPVSHLFYFFNNIFQQGGGGNVALVVN